MPFLKSPNGRFLSVLLLGELTFGVAMLALVFADGDASLADVYGVFGLLWWGGVSSLAAWSAYRLGAMVAASGPIRELMWLGGGLGATLGALLALIFTGFVSGHPVVVLPVIPALVFATTMGGLVMGAMLGAVVETFTSYMRDMHQ